MCWDFGSCKKFRKIGEGYSVESYANTEFLLQYRGM